MYLDTCYLHVNASSQTVQQSACLTAHPLSNSEFIASTMQGLEWAQTVFSETIEYYKACL